MVFAVLMVVLGPKSKNYGKEMHNIRVVTKSSLKLQELYDQADVVGRMRIDELKAKYGVR